NDGLLYAADRGAQRIDVTTRDGKYVKSIDMAAPGTKLNDSDRGAAGGVAFSPDKAQKFLYICDIKNDTIWFVDRQTGKIMGRLGQMGENGGDFFGLHMIATDSKG